MQLGCLCGQSSWFSWLHSQQIQIFPITGFWFEVLLDLEVVKDPETSILSEVVFVVVVGFIDFVLVVHGVVVFILMFMMVAFVFVLFMVISVVMPDI